MTRTLLQQFFWLTALTIALVGSRSDALEQSQLSGEVKNESIYFTQDSRLRHHRYSFELKQKTVILPYELSSVVSARFRTDLALYPDPAAPNWGYADEVINDEQNEGQLREAYLDWLGDGFRFRLGVMQIDWIDALAANSTNMLTPLDLRHGGFGDKSDVLEPVTAASFSHDLFGGSLEWLTVLQPRSHRLPKEDNGYGYYRTLRTEFEGLSLDVQDEETELKATEVEVGARYSISFDGADASFFAFRGHQRSPTLRAISINPTEMQINQTYPWVHTYGAFTSFSGDAHVFRFFAYHQPDRTVPLTIAFPADGVEEEEAKQQVSRGGIGFDYVFSKHLKFYSETSAQAKSTDPEEFYSDEEKPEPLEYVGTVKLTNESINDLLIGFTAIRTAPQLAWLLMPEVDYSIAKNYRLGLGARIIHTEDDQAAYAMIDEADQYYASFAYVFSIADNQ